MTRNILTQHHFRDKRRTAFALRDEVSKPSLPLLDSLTPTLDEVRVVINALAVTLARTIVLHCPLSRQSQIHQTRSTVNAPIEG